MMMLEPQLLLGSRSFAFLSSSSSSVVNRRCVPRKTAATPSPCRTTKRKRATGKASASLSSEATASSQASAATPVVPTHRVTVHDRQRGVVHQFLVPEDQYILHTAESRNISLPFACRHVECLAEIAKINTKCLPLQPPNRGTWQFPYGLLDIFDRIS